MKKTFSVLIALCMVFILVDIIFAIDPVPDIKANGQDGSITVSSGTPVSITVSLEPSDQSGQNADWWVAESTPSGTFNYYNLSTGSMVPGLLPTHQGPLFNLGTTQLLNSSDLTVGTHTFYFGVDMIMNGSLDFDQLDYDSVVVNIENSYKFTTEEALLSAAQGSNEFNDTLSYARELGYTGSLENVTEYPISGEPSVFIATISGNAGKMITIVYDPRTQPVFLPAYLIIPENEDTFRLITRNGGLLIENATSPDGPIISVIKGELQSTRNTNLYSKIDSDCKQAFNDALYCVVDKLTDFRETGECIIPTAVCVASTILYPPISWATFAPCMLKWAAAPCGKLALETMIKCTSKEILGGPCQDGKECTGPDTCVLGDCKGPPITKCIDDDECCPSGCNNLTDSDCEEGCEGPPYLCHIHIGSVCYDIFVSYDACENYGYSFLVTLYCSADSLDNLLSCLSSFLPATVCGVDAFANLYREIVNCEDKYW